MDFGGFINFKVMITPIIMKWFYLIGSVLIVIISVISGIGVIAAAFDVGGFGGFVAFVLGSFGVLIGLVVSLVLFRMFCEWLVLFFSMHSEIKEMNGKR